MALVYIHRKKRNGEIFYVGISEAVERAYSHHGRNFMWRRTASKHEFEVEILYSSIDWEDACLTEKLLIFIHGRKDKRLGTLVNLTDGGDGVPGFRRSRESIERGARKRKENYMYTEEHKRKLSESNKRHPSHQKGIKLSEEHKEKIRKANKGKVFPRWIIDKSTEVKKKKIICLTDDIIFDSVKEAANYAGCARTYFSTRLKKNKLIKHKKYTYYDLQRTV